MDKSVFFKGASGKKTNRRMQISVWGKDDGIVTIISTRRLVDKEKRHILESSVSYGIESLAVIREVLNLLFEDPEFHARANRELGQAQKEAWKIETNIDFKP